MDNDKDILNTAEIPYEVRMKYIIEAYRKDKERWAKLEPADEKMSGTWYLTQNPIKACLQSMLRQYSRNRQ